MGDDKGHPEAILAGRRWAEAHLDRASYGDDLARALWHAVMGRPLDDGLIHANHRDYCGHGLLRTTRGVKLCGIEDGHLARATIAAWEDEADFTAFWSRQSDWTSSGMEPAEPVLAATSEWDRCNQRLTREIIVGFIAGA